MELKEKSKMEIWCSHVCGELSVNRTSSYHDCFNENLHFELDFNLEKLKHGVICSQTRKLNAKLTCETIPP